MNQRTFVYFQVCELCGHMQIIKIESADGFEVKRLNRICQGMMGDSPCGASPANQDQFHMFAITFGDFNRMMTMAEDQIQDWLREQQPDPKPEDGPLPRPEDPVPTVSEMLKEPLWKTIGEEQGEQRGCEDCTFEDCKVGGPVMCEDPEQERYDNQRTSLFRVYATILNLCDASTWPGLPLRYFIQQLMQPDNNEFQIPGVLEECASAIFTTFTEPGMPVTFVLNDKSYMVYQDMEDGACWKITEA